MWTSTIVTLFPDMFPGPLGFSLAGKALLKSLWSLKTINIRDFGLGPYRAVDDTPYGGGAGMVMRPDVVHDALTYAQEQHVGDPAIIFMTPRGIPLKQSFVENISSNPSGCIVLCGHYEGIDDRVIEHWRNHEGLVEVSLGDYVLSGGELAACILLDACVRLIPGVLGNQESLSKESFKTDLLEGPHYTRPYSWNNIDVPDVLLSGHHGNIEKWRLERSRDVTRERRLDLINLSIDEIHSSSS